MPKVASPFRTVPRSFVYHSAAENDGGSSAGATDAVIECWLSTLGMPLPVHNYVDTQFPHCKNY